TVLPSSPEVEEISSSEEEANLAHLRQSYFNTNEKDTVIKWHFSNYTVKNNQDGLFGTADDKDGDFYRDLGRKAVGIYNRAFEIITKEYCAALGKKEGCKSITVEMAADEEDKDLGDLRYNLLNLVNAKVLGSGGLLGHAPSFVRQDSGQIIGTTSNVFIHTTLKRYQGFVESYIRYEIFRNKDGAVQVSSCKSSSSEDSNGHGTKNALVNNQAHVVSCYVREKIQERCQGVQDFILEKRKDLALKPEDSLNDGMLLEQCSRKISEEVILSTILHEMGHSFGLGHNFKASIDGDNYYKDLAEIKKYFPNSEGSQWTKSSSVMDYLPLDQPPMVVLGKYDLAVLRYLYLDQLETQSYKGYHEEGQDIEAVLMNLEIPTEPETQTALSQRELSQMKSYQACWDSLVGSKEEHLCLRFDYGSTPKEIVQNYIGRFQQNLNDRYKYGRVGVIHPLVYISGSSNILRFYEKWIGVRDEYFLSQGLESVKYVAFGDEEGIEQYAAVLEKGIKNSSDSEYSLYYPVREPIANFMQNFLLLETMKCQVHKGNEEEAFFLDLEDIKNKLSGNNNLYVRDCLSGPIQTFLTDNGLTYMGQKGLEFFKNYNFRKEEKDVDLLSRDELLDSYLFLSQANIFAFFDEPDFFQSFINRLEARVVGESAKDISVRDMVYISGFQDFPGYLS
ncbi:MAG: zinc-dependent metalloprotease, partial [Oligoflexia bacterium]|nr:zinc-dependent metalloprotease [Oligoflexia bacterium]